MAPLLDRLIVSSLRIFFRLLYHPFAWTYDFVAAGVSAGQWRSWVASALPYISGPRVLELGFGPGHLQAALHAAGIHVVGLDASRQMAALSFRRIVRLGFNPMLVNGYAQILPFPHSTFDQVVSTFPTDYIFQPDTLAEIHRVLVPGGCLVTIPSAWITGKSLPHRLLAGLFRITHESPPDASPELLQTLRRPFERSGFTTETHLVRLPDSNVLLILARKPFD